MEFKIVADNTFYVTAKIGCSDCPEYFNLNELYYEYRFYNEGKINIYFTCKKCMERFDLIKYKNLRVRFHLGSIFVAYVSEKNTKYVIEQYKQYALL